MEEQRIIEILQSGYAGGLSITELVNISQESRSAIRITLAKLEGAGRIGFRKIGMAKVYFQIKDKQANISFSGGIALLSLILLLLFLLAISLTLTLQNPDDLITGAALTESVLVDPSVTDLIHDSLISPLQYNRSIVDDQNFSNLTKINRSMDEINNISGSGMNSSVIYPETNESFWPNETSFSNKTKQQEVFLPVVFPEEDGNNTTNNSSAHVTRSATQLQIILPEENISLGEFFEIEAILQYRNGTPATDQKIDFYGETYFASAYTDDLGKAKIYQNTSFWGIGEYTLSVNYSGSDLLTATSGTVFLVINEKNTERIVLQNRTLRNEFGEADQNISADGTEYFYWKRRITNSHQQQVEVLLADLKLPLRLKELTQDIEREENELLNAGSESISENSVQGEHLYNLRKELEAETSNIFQEVRINNLTSAIKEIFFNDLMIKNELIYLGVEDVKNVENIENIENIKDTDNTSNTRKISAEGTIVEINGYSPIQTYAIDPAKLNFTTAQVTVVARGEKLYKCNEWNFSEQRCYGNWFLFKSSLIPGREYTFTLTPDDPAFTEVISSCAKEDSAAKGSFGTACSPASGSAVAKNDGVTDTATYQRNGKYGGFRIQSVNSSITNCASITTVSICYERWRTAGDTMADCDISVDANAGASYSVVTTICPGATANPGLTCTDVTALETWTCSNFFGATGTRAQAKGELTRTNAGGASTSTWDALYFSVVYAETDTTAPTVTFVAPTPPNNFAQTGGSIIINVTVTDTQSSINNCILQFDGVNQSMTRVGTGSSVSCNITKGMTDGSHTFTVFANDTAGNIGTSATRTVKRDSTGPAITIIPPTPANNSIIGNTSVVLNASVTDVLSNISICTVSFDDVNTSMVKTGTGSSVNCSSVHSGLADGKHNFTIFANDSLGNTNGSGLFFLTVDTIKPSIDLNFPPEAFNTTNNFLSFNWTASDNIDTSLSCDLTLDGTVNASAIASPNNTPTNYTISNISGGTHTWNVSCTDDAGNSNSSETRTFAIDVVNPSIFAIFPEENTSFSTSNASFTSIIEIAANITNGLSAIDTALANLTEPNGTIQEIVLTNVLATNKYNTSFTIPVLSGRYNISFFANDSLGNINNSESTYFIAQDVTDPIINITFPLAGETYYTLGLTLNWTFTEDNPDTCWYTLENGTAVIVNTTVACTALSTNFTALAFVNNTLTLWINDSSDNQASDNATFYARPQTAPNVTNVTITPTYNSGFYVSTLNNMHCNYTFNDAEGDADQGAIAWYNNSVLQPAFANATTIASANTSLGETWRCQVTPYDGIDVGTEVNSSQIEINVEPTNMQVSANATIYVGPAPNNQYTIWAYYTDEDNNPILGASCSISGNPSSTLPDNPVEDGNYSKVFQWSTTGEKTHSFSCSKSNYQTQNGVSRTVNVTNHPTNLVAQQTASVVNVSDSIVFVANYSDANTSSLLTLAACNLNVSGYGIFFHDRSR